jgi:hypothetical protein
MIVSRSLFRNVAHRLACDGTNISCEQDVEFLTTHNVWYSFEDRPKTISREAIRGEKDLEKARSRYIDIGCSTTLISCVNTSA